MSWNSTASGGTSSSSTTRPGRPSSAGAGNSSKRRFSRDFDEGVAIWADLTRTEIRIVATRENIDTRDDSAGAKYFRRVMLAQGAYQAESTGERARVGLNRAKAEGKKLGRPPALD